MHFVSYCETELFEKTYRNNLNNVLQNLLNEFYTYAKSGLIAKKGHADWKFFCTFVIGIY